jgi:hypothetical protein
MSIAQPDQTASQRCRRRTLSNRGPP